MTKPRFAGPYAGWALVALLTLVHILSYVDRMLPLLLIEQIKHNLALSDFQLGVLIGPAFATFYILFAIPLGWLVDRWNRTSLLAAAILFWSGLTALAGIASTFTLLFASRLGVGMAEACLSPCALSLISAVIPPARRIRAVAIFQAGSTTGSFVAMAGGGWLAAFLEGRPRLTLPIFGAFEPWQEIFLISAVLGIPLAVILFALRDPRAERGGGGTSAADRGQAGELGTYLSSNRVALFCLLLVGIGYTVFGNLASWSVAVFTRIWHWDVAQAGLVSGSLALVGALSGGALAVFITGGKMGGRAPRPFDAIIIGLILDLVTISTFAQAPSAIAAAALYFCGILGMGCAVTGAMSALTLAVPSSIRGRVAALYFFCVTLVGMALLQPIVGKLSDRHGLPTAITALALIFGVIAILGAFAGRNRVHAIIERYEFETIGNGSLLMAGQSTYRSS